VTTATTQAEWEAALEMLAAATNGRRRVTLGAATAAAPWSGGCSPWR
jgi:hypothetical protein